VILCFNREQIFVHSFRHQLGRIRRDLNQLEAEKLLVGSAADLAAIGYHFNFGLDESETLLSLTSGPISQVLQGVTEPAGLVFQHCHAESAVLPYDPGEPNIALRSRYFPGEVMRHLQIDDVPYFCSFASGCSGFMSLLGAAGGVLLPSLDNRSVLCVMADCRPPGCRPFDMKEERILGSDHSSAFVVGREQCGYQLLGINYYSTARTKVPFVEIVKRTVQMIQELAQRLNVEVNAADVAIHYPNIFPATWKMVTRYLQLPRAEHILDDIADRAHCGATDSVISLAKHYRMQVGRLHVAVNYGVGLHLGVCMLRETGTPWSESN
jgi:hypothetical protein